MSFAWVTRQYGLSIRRGTELRFEGRPAVVTSATNYLHVRFTDGGRPATAYLHPMWHTEYPLASANAGDL